MLAHNPSRYLLTALAFVTVNALIFSYRASTEANAQLGCRTPPVHEFGISYTWPAGTPVNVNIDPFWSGAMRDAIEDGYDAWEAANLFTCSGVTFNPATDNSTPAGLMNGSTLPSGNNTYVFPFNQPGFQKNTVGANGRIVGVIVGLPACKTDLVKLRGTSAHEIGHSFGLANCSANSIPPCSTKGQSIMGPTGGGAQNDPGGCEWDFGGLEGPTLCDSAVVAGFYCLLPTPTPTPTPASPPCPVPLGAPPPGDPGCPWLEWMCKWGCQLTLPECEAQGWIYDLLATRCHGPLGGGDGAMCPVPTQSYECGDIIPETNCPFVIYGFGSCYSPVLIDTAGDGFALTDAAGGVLFDLDGNPDKVKEQVSWTLPNSDDSWLALDRNGNGVIDSGRELFGNLTLQPAAAERNGFIALARYDRPESGGNGDGVVDHKDVVFPHLRLWRDGNHNGVSEAAELHPLPAFDVVRLHLDYKESKRMDIHGNEFRYRAKMDDAKGAKVGRWAWDVFLVRGK